MGCASIVLTLKGNKMRPLQRHLVNLIDFLIMSQTFAIFLLENANNGNEILAVLDDIVEVTDTVL